MNNALLDIKEIENVLNNLNNEPLIIMADDYSNEVLNTILSLYLDNFINCILLKTPGYGMEKLKILDNIKKISKAFIVNGNSDVTDLGEIEEIKIDEKEIVITTSNPEFSTLKKVEIYVGAFTETERHERKMHYEDAFNALSNIKKGVVMGSGMAYLEVANNLNTNNIGLNLLKNALVCPIKQLLINAGISEEKIIKEIVESNYNIIYNITKEKFEDVKKSGVIDSYKVVESALKNAVSIAGMLLTTTSLIINEMPNELGKISNYTEL